jgi:hypothetical protein
MPEKPKMMTTPWSAHTLPPGDKIFPPFVVVAIPRK